MWKLTKLKIHTTREEIELIPSKSERSQRHIHKVVRVPSDVPKSLHWKSRIFNQSINQLIKQSFNQACNQYLSINRSFNQLSKQVSNQANNQIKHVITQSISQATVHLLKLSIT